MGTVPLPLPWKVPNGVRNTETIRRSDCERFGKRLQWLGDVHVVGLSVRRMRWFMPAATWLTAWPVRMSTHVPRLRDALHRAGAGLPGVPLVGRLAAQRELPLRLEFALGSQSRDCVWLSLP